MQTKLTSAGEETWQRNWWRNKRGAERLGDTGSRPELTRLTEKQKGERPKQMIRQTGSPITRSKWASARKMISTWGSYFLTIQTYEAVTCMSREKDKLNKSSLIENGDSICYRAGRASPNVGKHVSEGDMQYWCLNVTLSETPPQSTF